MSANFFDFSREKNRIPLFCKFPCSVISTEARNERNREILPKETTGQGFSNPFHSARNDRNGYSIFFTL